MEPVFGITSETHVINVLQDSPSEGDGSLFEKAQPLGSHLVETLRWLCLIPSFTGEEGPICDALVERLSGATGATDATGATGATDATGAVGARLAGPIRRYGASIVVPVTRSKEGEIRPKIALVGHTDVVRTSHDGGVRLSGDRFYGPGASDMKAGLALMLDLAEGGRDAADGVDLTLVFYAREEGPFAENELGIVLPADEELRGVDLAVCLEPSDNKLSLGASGSIHANVIFRGRTAHSARPWQGENAIHKAGPFLCDLAARGPREVTLDGLVYRTVTTVTMAQGGRGRNVVPDELSLNVNHRFSPDTSIEEAQREIETLVNGRADIEWRDLSPSALPHAKHPLVEKLGAAGVAGVEPKQAWTDVARFATFGIPAVNFGPGVNAQAHQRNEWTSVSKLHEGQKILKRWLRDVAGAEAGDGAPRAAPSRGSAVTAERSAERSAERARESR